MRWDAVLTAAVAALKADAALVTALGGARVYDSRAPRDLVIPSVTWTLVSDVEEEVWERIVVQFDIWSRPSIAPAIDARTRAATIERRVRRVLHSDVFRALGGVVMATLFQEGRDHDDPDPEVVHRSVDFRFEPFREKYVSP